MVTARRGGRRGWWGRWPVLVLVVLLLVGVAVVAQLAGPAEFGAPRTGLLDVERPFGAQEPETAPAEETEILPDDVPGLPGWTLLAWLMTVLAMVALALKWLVGLLREKDGTAAPTRGQRADVAADDLLVLAAVRQGVRDAGAALDSAVAQEAERDVVVRCWLALERAAEHAGTQRSAAQTPTEFTASLLRTHRADAAATAELLGLYHRARFGRSPLGPGSVAAARDALDRIAATLAAPRDVPVPGTGGGSRG